MPLGIATPALSMLSVDLIPEIRGITSSSRYPDSHPQADYLPKPYDSVALPVHLPAHRLPWGAVWAGCLQ